VRDFWFPAGILPLAIGDRDKADRRFLSGETSMNKVPAHDREKFLITNYWEGSPTQGLSGVLHSAGMKHEKNHQVLQATAGLVRFLIERIFFNY
jgi:hypothetical protein